MYCGIFLEEIANSPYFYRLISHPMSTFERYKGSRCLAKIDNPNTLWFFLTVISFIIVH